MFGVVTAIFSVVIPSEARDLQFRRLTPAISQVLPSRVHSFDQGKSLRTRPRLYLFFANKSVVHVLEGLVIDQPVNVVLLCEAFDFTRLMLQRAVVDVSSYAGVEGQRAAGHDVDVITLLFSH